MGFQNYTITNGVNHNFHSNGVELTIYNASTTVNLYMYNRNGDVMVIRPLDSFTDGFTYNFDYRLESAGADISVSIMESTPINRENSGSW